MKEKTIQHPKKPNEKRKKLCYKIYPFVFVCVENFFWYILVRFFFFGLLYLYYIEMIGLIFTLKRQVNDFNAQKQQPQTSAFIRERWRKKKLYARGHNLSIYVFNAFDSLVFIYVVLLISWHLKKKKSRIIRWRNIAVYHSLDLLFTFFFIYLLLQPYHFLVSYCCCCDLMEVFAPFVQANLIFIWIMYDWLLVFRLSLLLFISLCVYCRMKSQK